MCGPYSAVRLDVIRWVCPALLVMHCAAACASQSAAPSMRDIIEGVRSSAALYENIEMCATKDYTLVNSPGGDTKTTLVRRSIATERCVYQDRMLFFRRDTGKSLTDGKEERDDLLRGYDGQTTRALHHGTIANVINARAEHGGMLRPHSLVIRSLIGNFPLADFLLGGRAARRHAGFRDAEVTVSYDGEDVVDGLLCYRLKLLYALDVWKDGKGPTVRFLWIAPDRNYLPVRTEFFNRGKWKPGAKPADIGWVEDLREIAPGVWFPFRVVYDVYDVWTESKVGTRQLCNREVLTIQKAELDPKYDVSLFRDIPFPDGAFVYHVENDKIVRSYVKGGRNTIAPNSKSGGITYAALGVLLLVVAGGTFWALRVRRPARPLGVSGQVP